MEIAVCVKRVPQMQRAHRGHPRTGRTWHAGLPGFAISPHEECAVEEAVQITERLGGTVSVLTLGPAEAADQLRDALSLGAHRAVLLEDGDRAWGCPGRHGGDRAVVGQSARPGYAKESRL